MRNPFCSELMNICNTVGCWIYLRIFN